MKTIHTFDVKFKWKKLLSQLERKLMFRNHRIFRRHLLYFGHLVLDFVEFQIAPKSYRFNVEIELITSLLIGIQR